MSFCSRVPSPDVIELASLFAFVPAALVIITVPGPDAVYVLTQSIKSGRRVGLSAGLGVASGILVHTTAAILGLAALLRTSALAYAVVKYVGGLYLLYLGVHLFRNDEEVDVDVESLDGDRSPVQAYQKAVVVNVSNPKVAVFVLAFFPQFVPAQANVTLQMSLFGVLYAVLTFSYLSGVTLFAAQVRRRLLDSTLARRAVQYASGSVLLGVGAKLVLESRPTP
jgi:threonine/homoserine/homoserine lactone efflux protein